MKKRIYKYGLPVVAVALLSWAAWYWGIIPQRTYTAADFGIETLQGTVDFNQNGADDYADILAGAKKDAQNRPRYNGDYCATGYPDEDVGVCTDLVWRAFREAGYSLRSMVDADIIARPDAYEHIEKRDNNIDFRRVVNLHIFFEKYAVTLTTDVQEIDQWQPGDIVVFGADKHIGIVSDKRNKKGQPYILHNGGQPRREENYLPRAEVTAHYRFDASLLPRELLIEFE